jgi:hypothetical protein
LLLIEVVAAVFHELHLHHLHLFVGDLHFMNFLGVSTADTLRLLGRNRNLLLHLLLLLIELLLQILEVLANLVDYKKLTLSGKTYMTNTTRDRTKAET